MANCSYLLNDGSLILLNDGTSNLLLNDNTCGGAVGVSDARLDTTGTGTAAFIGNSLASNAAFGMTGTASVLFRAFTDARYGIDCTVTAQFRSPIVPVEDQPLPSTGAGGALAWRTRQREEEGEKRRRAALLLLIRASDDYRRLKRKLAMLQEHLLDARGRVETVTVKEKIADIEAQIEMMERLD
jgi:hypothetical protein